MGVLWFCTAIRQYPNNPDLFIQTYPDGSIQLSGTGKSPDKVISSFTSFLLDNKELWFNQWWGIQLQYRNIKMIK